MNGKDIVSEDVNWMRRMGAKFCGRCNQGVGQFFKLTLKIRVHCGVNQNCHFVFFRIRVN
jgi:hypothetical protein